MSVHGKQAESGSTFTFGVSGHRDPLENDCPELQKQVGIVFERFRRAYPDAAFELLSPLAEGADRIAAEVALRSDVRLVVPLPMAQAEYERDFATTESLHEFRRLLATAASAFEVHTERSSRANKYAAVGDYIARRSNVLILLWDGEDNSKLGGTAWVKKRRKHWINLSKTDDSASNALGYAGTIQIVTPRRASTGRRPRIEIIGDLPSATGT